MTTKTQRRPREPRPLGGADHGGGVAKPQQERFDAHRWFERYTTSHHDADPDDLLAGVPFN